MTIPAPMAILSLNCPDLLIAQAEQLERDAGRTDLSISAGTLGGQGREHAWRAAAALRVVAYLAADEPNRLAAYAIYIDGDRAESDRGGA